MKRIILLLAGCFLIPGAYSQKVEVVLIGGQSNGTGQGYVRNVPASFETDTSVMIYYSKYMNQGKGAERWQPLCPASETKDRFGVELSLGTALQNALPHKRFCLVKHACSGSNLYKQWNPGNRTGEEQGQEYKKFIVTVQKALQELEEKGWEPVVRAMVWQQGENDARNHPGTNSAENYGKNLKNFIRQVRKEVDNDSMIFVYGSVLPYELGGYPGREPVRKAQKEVDENSGSPFSVRNAVFVPADHLQMRAHDYRSPMPGDFLHLGTFGILTLGESFAGVIVDKLKE